MDDERTARVKAHIEHSSGRSVESIALAPLPGGAVQESFDVRVEWAGAAPLTDALPSRFVLRSDTPEPLPASLDRRVEYGVVNAAVAAGVPTPEARWLADGLVRPGAWAYLLDFAQGTALGRKVVSSAQLAGAREGLTAALANALTRIHHVPLPTLPHELESPRDPAAHQVSQLREMSERLPHRRPACEYVLCWLEDNLPSPQRLSLVHGDFRTGNFLVSPAGLEAVLDWEFAHVGAPEEDIAWLCVRDWRFGELALAAGGVAERWAFYRAYERAAGAEVDAERIHFWEIFGNLRWALGCAHQAARYARGGVRDLELLAIGRRSAEMEYEALRLIEVGVS